MISLDEIQKRLMFHEGVRLRPYRCSKGYLSIGIGRNLETNPLTIEEQKICGDFLKGITKDMAKFLLENDIKRCISELKKNISFFLGLDDERQYALLDMCFNLGIIKLLQFKKMLYFFSVKDYQKAAKECLNSKYASDVGKRALRISRLIEKGVWEEKCNV